MCLHLRKFGVALICDGIADYKNRSDLKSITCVPFRRLYWTGLIDADGRCIQYHYRFLRSFR